MLKVTRLWPHFGRRIPPRGDRGLSAAGGGGHHPATGYCGLDVAYLVTGSSRMRQNIADRKMERTTDLDGALRHLGALRASRAALNEIRRQRNAHAALALDPARREEGRKLRQQADRLQRAHDRLRGRFLRRASQLPNWIDDAAPRGSTPVLIAESEARPPAPTAPRPLSHMDLVRRSKAAIFPTHLHHARKFCYARADLALLEVALVNWALQRAAALGFVPHTTPDVIATDYVEACGFRPRSRAAQIYRVRGARLCLIGTAEIALAALHAHRCVPDADLPILMSGFSHCFRRETGPTSEGRGFYRVHQFSKVELFVYCRPWDSAAWHHRLLAAQRAILDDLGLPYRVLDMPSEDLGAAASRKFDIEAWMPFRDDYGEVTSCSNCTDYQTRRLGVRGADRTYLHSLNATALAVPRIMIAILENLQDADGAVRVPPPLVPFVGRTHLFKTAANEPSSASGPPDL